MFRRHRDSSESFHRSVRLCSHGVLFAGLLTLSVSFPADAQSADQIRRIQTVEPLSGPVGTAVHVHTENLPLQARTHVGVGARHIGFEALVEVEQGEWGEVTAELEIPAWATWDRPVVLLILNGVFSPTGHSDPFHVTNVEGMIQRTGQVSHKEGSCVVFRDQDDYLYSLEGLPSDLEPGDEVIVEGIPSERVGCGPGVAIRVKRLVPIRRVAIAPANRR